MKQKKIFYAEAAYVLGELLLALGTALMTKADFGISMVVAPAYLLHLKVSQFWPVFSFGMSEYVFQAFLLVLLCAVTRQFKRGYLFSFITAVFYGLMLDGAIALFSLLPDGGIAGRAVYYLVGMALSSAGVAFMFHTYISQAAYELFVKEVAEKYGLPIHRFKLAYDCVSCLIGVALSFAFFGFGRFEGVKLGTVLCALINGPLIGFISGRLEQSLDFRDGLPLRGVFSK